MTSKRILEYLYNASKIGITSNENAKILKDYYKLILKDLNRLEKLEEENKQLKAKLDRSLPRLVIRNTLDNVLPSLEEENEKLKQALDILKDKLVNIDMLILSFQIDIGRESYNACVEEPYQLTQEEYDLLKEVLLDEKED